MFCMDRCDLGILACEIYEWVGIKKGMILLWDETLYSWGGNDQWYGFSMGFEWRFIFRGWYETV